MREAGATHIDVFFLRRTVHYFHLNFFYNLSKSGRPYCQCSPNPYIAMFKAGDYSRLPEKSSGRQGDQIWPIFIYFEIAYFGQFLLQKYIRSLNCWPTLSVVHVLYLCLTIFGLQFGRFFSQTRPVTLVGGHRSPNLCRFI
jgi:hypothetical protein